MVFNLLKVKRKKFVKRTLVKREKGEMAGRRRGKGIETKSPNVVHES